MTEDDYCRELADALVHDTALRQALLVETKFADRRHAALLIEELSVRPAKAWWRHWWTRLPDGSESETDLFLVFMDQSDGLRFALHIECKTASGKFAKNQAGQYAVRGEFMKSNKWVPYTQFDTVLLAPNAFIEKHESEASAFGSVISFEQISKWLPTFRGG